MCEAQSSPHRPARASESPYTDHVGVESDVDTPTEATRTAVERVPAAPEIELERGTCVGRFVVLEKLGAGGMGVVYKAYDPRLDRQIAIKLLRLRLTDDGTSRDRLMREAQALAQLSHPNVVAVYDVGDFDDMLFLAMELVPGQTLRAWLTDETRSQSDTLAAFVAAGRGLAAAHRAGIVHRDFKPDNVIVGDDGRARVLDFGLARADEDTAHDSIGERLLSSDLTQAGSVMGTPVYMAPEQCAGERADARTDQFSFCVALYQALYGEHPFGESRLGTDVDWRVQDPHAHGDVPDWLRDVLLRGLDESPARRYESMDVLLDALQSDPRARSLARRRTAAWVAASLALGVGAFAGLQALSPEKTSCADSRSLLAGVWDAPTRATVERAFIASGSPYARQTWDPVNRVITRYADEWATMRTETCRATVERGEQSEQTMDARMLCLAQLHAELDALTDVLSEADAAVVERAVSASHALSAVRECTDGARLSAHATTPDNREAVQDLRARIARAKTLQTTGRYQAGLEVAEATIARAREVEYAPAEAEALYWRGRLEESLADYAASEATLREAAAVAERAGYDELRAMATAQLVYVVGYRRARYEEARHIGEAAHAVLDRIGGHELERATLLSHLGTVYFAESKFDEAAEHDRRALDIRERLLGSDHPDVASSLNNLGLLYCDLGACDRAVEPLERALAIRRRVFGEDHPLVAMSLNNAGVAYFKLGRTDDARDAYTRGLAIRKRALGPDHPRLAFSHEGLGIVALAAGDHATALSHYRTAVALRTAALGDDHPDVAYAIDGVGDALLAAGDARGAIDQYRRSLGILERAFGVDNVDYALTLANVAAAERVLGDDAAALRHYRTAAAIVERDTDPNNPELAKMYVDMAAIESARGRGTDAAALRQRAIDICAARRCEPKLLEAVAATN